eukprot:6378921-Prymnesium_polylepis.2
MLDDLEEEPEGGGYGGSGFGDDDAYGDALDGERAAEIAMEMEDREIARIAAVPVVQGTPPPGETSHAALTAVRARLLEGGGGGGKGWNEDVSQAEVVELMRRVRYLHEAELQEDLYPVVAEWFEVQCFERFRTVVHEGSWAHSFYILASGTAEASERC